MYLFVRRARLGLGSTRDSIHWATDILERANSVTNLGLELYAQVWSPEVGDLAWTAWAEDLRTLEQANDKLMADDGYIELLDQAARYCIAPPADGLSQIVHGSPEPGNAYVSVTGSACTNGRLTEGFAAGIRLAEAATALSGHETMVTAGVTGPYGAISWLSGAPDVATLEEGNRKVNGDPSFLRLVDETSPSFTDDPFATQQMIYRKLA